MESWWELGEGSGFSGDKMDPWRLTCAFCGEKGHFLLKFHGEKRKSNSSKRLNFDVYQCTNCMAFVHVIWSAAEFSNSIYAYTAMPLPIGKLEPSTIWPDAVQRFWIQAHESLRVENWDAAVVMARSALQAAMRDKNAVGGNLKAEIKDLASKGTLHPMMQDWSTEVRELGNDSAHPLPDAAPTNPQDARDVVQFLDFLLFYLHDFPKQISDYRERRNSPE
jgi:hypothetical protein